MQKNTLTDQIIKQYQRELDELQAREAVLRTALNTLTLLRNGTSPQRQKDKKTAPKGQPHKRKIRRRRGYAAQVMRILAESPRPLTAPEIRQAMPKELSYGSRYPTEKALFYLQHYGHLVHDAETKTWRLTNHQNFAQPVPAPPYNQKR